jgi:hypothetical protein
VSEEQDARSEQEIIGALNRLREEPYGASRSARTEELVEAAERNGHDRALVIAQFELLTAYEYGAEARKAPVLFSRILAMRTAKPEAFDEWAEHRLYWCFKWISAALSAIPEVPLATVEQWIAQMGERYRAAGKPLQAVHTSRYKLAAHTGVGADLAYELWATRPRDEFSDCEACEARYRGGYWAQRGEDARALKEWAPVLEGTLTCAEEPASTVAEALIPLVRTGRAAEAVSLHRSGYRATKGRVSMDTAVARHLEFLALTGNSARGLELLAQNRYRFESTATPLTRFTFLSGVRVLLGRLVAEGNGSAPVTGPGGRTQSAAELLAQVAAETDELARRFDARNGTTHQGDQLRAACAQPPLTAEPLELGLRVTAPPLAPVPAAAPAAVAIPEEFAALVAQARAALADGRPEQRRLWQAVADRAAAEAQLDDELRAELADREAFRLVPQKQWGEAEALLRESARLFDLAGLPGRAAARRSRAAWCAFQRASDAGTATWDELDELLAAADALLAAGSIEDEDYCIVRHSRAAAAQRALGRKPGGGDGARAAAQQPDRGERDDAEDDGDDEAFSGDATARERFDREVERFHAAAVRLGQWHRAAISRSMAARAMESDDDLKAAAALAAEAVELVERAAWPWALPEFLAQSGHLLNRLGRLEEAAGLLHRAMALATEWPDPEANMGGLLMELAWNRINAGDTTAGIGHLTAAAARFDRQRRAKSAVTARVMLGQALVESGRVADGVAVFESVLDEEAEARLSRPERAQLRLDLGRALMRTGEPRSAAEVFVRLAAFVADWPDPAVPTLVACSLAGALFAAEVPEQAEAAVARARELHAKGPNAAALSAMLRLAANSAMDADGADGARRALACLDEADTAIAAAEERPGAFRRWPESAQNEDLRAQILSSVGRHEEALAAAEAAALAWERGGSQSIDEWAEAMRVAALIEGARLGRREQAASRIDAAVARCKLADRDRAVKILTQLARSLGE